MAFDAGAVVMTIKLDSSGFDKSVDNVKHKNESMTGSFVKANLIIAGVQAGFTALTGIVKSGIEAFKTQEKVETQLNAVLKSTQNAVGLTANEIKNMASNLQSVTTFGDEAILSGQNMLLTFTNIGKDVFPKATETMLDMSQALGQDLKSSAMQLGKALNDPIQGVTALRRVGVQLTNEQEGTIKKMVEMNDVAGAQKIILAELEREFGGSARAMRDTFGGALTSLKNIQGDIMEEIGRFVAIIGKDLVEGLIQGATAIYNFIKSSNGIEIISDIASKIAVGFNLMWTYGKDLFNFLKDSVIGIMDNLKKQFEDSGIKVDLLAVALTGLNVIFKFIKLGITTVAIVINNLIDTFSAFFRLIKDFAPIVVKLFQGDVVGAFKDFGKIDFQKTLKDMEKVLTSPVKLFADLAKAHADFVIDIAQNTNDEVEKQQKKVLESQKKYQDKIKNQLTQNSENSSKEMESITEDSLNTMLDSWHSYQDEIENVWNDSAVMSSEATEQNKKDAEDSANAWKQAFSDIGQILQDFGMVIKENSGLILDSFGSITIGAQSIMEAVLALKNGVEKTGKEIAAKALQIASAITSILASIYSDISANITKFLRDDIAEQEKLLAKEIEQIEEKNQEKMELLEDQLDEERQQLRYQYEQGYVGYQEYRNALQEFDKNAAIKKKNEEKKLKDEQEKIEKEHQKKINDMKKKEFEINKGLSIANVWVNFATASMALFASLAAIPFGIGLAIAGALTAGVLLPAAIASTVLIAQQQPPAFAKGGMASGTIQMNEQGGEIVTLPDGSQVVPNDISRQIAANVGNGGNQNVFNFVFNEPQIRKEEDMQNIADYVIRELGLRYQLS